MKPYDVAKSAELTAEFLAGVHQSRSHIGGFRGGFTDGTMTWREVMAEAAPRSTGRVAQVGTFAKMSPAARLRLLAWWWPSPDLGPVYPAKGTRVPARDPDGAYETAVWLIRETTRLSCPGGDDASDKVKVEWATKMLTHLQFRANLTVADLRYLAGPSGSDLDPLRARPEGEAPYSWPYESSPYHSDVVELTLRDVALLSVHMHVTCKPKSGWEIQNIDLLREEVEASVSAAEAVSRLRTLPADVTRNAAGRLPKTAVTETSPARSAAASPPSQASAYRALYVYLRERPDELLKLAFDDINEVNRAKERPPLPEKAREAGWWAGSARGAAGKTQLAAWWAAGYEAIVAADDEGRVNAVTFVAADHRTEWWERHRNAETGDVDLEVGYTPPSPPPQRTLIASRTEKLAQLEEREREQADERTQQEANAEREGVEWLESMTMAEMAGTLSDMASTVDDQAVARIVDAIRARGAMRRGDITDIPGLRGFHDARSRVEDVEWSPWVSNLVRKAKRRGLIENKGSRTDPLWVLTSITKNSVTL